MSRSLVTPDGKKFQEVRKAMGLTQQELVEKIRSSDLSTSISKRTLEKIENGTSVSRRYAAAVCTALEREFSDLVKSTPEELGSRDEQAYLKSLLAKLPECTNESLVLRALWDIAQTCGLANMRYYRYYHDPLAGGVLVSADALGHSEEKVKEWRWGLLKRFEARCSDTQSDAFSSIRRRKPVLIRIDTSAEEELYEDQSPTQEQDWAVLVTRRDQAGEMLSGDRASNERFNYPLLAGDTGSDPEEGCVGKLSCDLRRGADHLRAYKFWEYAKIAAPYLELLRRREFSNLARSKELEEARLDIGGFQNFENLSTYCTLTLPKLLCKCHNASLFSVFKDSRGHRKLVLEKTSFKSAQAKEKTAPYALDDPLDRSLTKNVGAGPRSIRLHHLTDPKDSTSRNWKIFEMQLSGYGDKDRIWWGGPDDTESHVSDSSNHTSFLGVPILSPATKELLGVMRFSEKSTTNRGAEPHFTQNDEELLEKVSGDCIAPQMEILKHRAIPQAIMRNARNVEKFCRTGRADDNFSERICELMESFFPQTLGEKYYGVIHVLPGGERYSVTATGKLAESRRNEDSLDESLTQFAIIRQSEHFARLQHGAAGNLDEWKTRYGQVPDDLCITSLNDTKNTVGLLKQSNLGVCVISCPVLQADSIRAILVVFSDKYDISPDVEGCLMQYISSLVTSVCTQPDSQWPDWEPIGLPYKQSKRG